MIIAEIMKLAYPQTGLKQVCNHLSNSNISLSKYRTDIILENLILGVAVQNKYLIFLLMYDFITVNSCAETGSLKTEMRANNNSEWEIGF